MSILFLEKNRYTSKKKYKKKTPDAGEHLTPSEEYMERYLEEYRTG